MSELHVSGIEHYHTERPHQAKGNVPLTGEWPEAAEEPPSADTVTLFG